MIGFLKKIFLRPKTVDDFLDSEKGHLAKVGSWIDKQQFTDEEKAKMNTALAASVRQFAIDTGKESTERSKNKTISSYSMD